MLEKRVGASPSVLVTGSTGFVGSSIVEALVAKGFRVRAFVRKTSGLERLEHLDVEIFVGDIADLVTLKPAFDGMDYVVHAAADTAGSVEGGRLNTILGTKHILALSQQCRIKKLVYISSCSVYGVADFEKGTVVNENSALERMPASRGAYSNAKIQAEKIVLQAMQEGAFPIVCLRPGTVYGPGGKMYPPIMGVSCGRKIFFTIGGGRLVLPLVFVSNIADAVRVVVEKEESNGNIYNVIDPYQFNKKQYVERLVKIIYPKAKHIYLPYSILYFIVSLQEKVFKLIGSEPLLTTYRLEASQKEVVYDGNKIRRELEWIPPLSLEDALKRIIKYERPSRD